jgi:hypothetical protein
VWIKDLQREGKGVRKCYELWSYEVKAVRGTLRRNQVHLNKLSESCECLDDTSISDFSLEGVDMHDFNINLPEEILEQQADDRPGIIEGHEEVQP